MKKEKKVRQPVVAVMGHVDHGKTTFLDAIRGSRVAEKEAGGITQNTRAHEVTLPSGNKITFIDTPGHEAFSTMRERGVLVTDFVLLIIAADDGIQPQTKESIKFAQDNKVPIIVAINKVDLEGVNTQKIKSQLSNFGVQIEEYGGDVLCYEISAKNKIGLDKLLEGIELLAEIHELKGSLIEEGLLAKAFVLESVFEKHLGNIGVCIVKAGKLNNKAYGVSESGIFKIRALYDENLKTVNDVLESQPVWISGLKKPLNTGEIVYFVETESEAKSFLHEKLKKDESREQHKPLDTESLFAEMLLKKEEEKQGISQKKLNIILKAKTQGTIEAILTQLDKLETEEAKIEILYHNTGIINEEDIFRAKAAKAIIVSFQMKPTNQILQIAKTEKVLIRNYEIIYEMIDELSDALDALADNFEEEIEIARAKIKKIFVLSDGTIVAGSEVISGTFVKGYKVWVERGDLEVGRGKITSIKQGKNETKEVKKGLECGIIIEPQIELEEGDEIVAFRVEK
jgi:translation initiation factor IF-2